MILDLTKYTVEELHTLKNEIDNHVHSYRDGYVYICKIRSYGRNWTERMSNTYTLQELCYKYDGYDGIIDIYSTNPDLSMIENYGDLKYIVSESDYDKWEEYTYSKKVIPEIIDTLEKWENRENVSFRERPTFAPIYTREDLERMEKELAEYDMSFIPPAPYDTKL